MKVKVSDDNISTIIQTILKAELRGDLRKYCVQSDDVDTTRTFYSNANRKSLAMNAVDTLMMDCDNSITDTISRLVHIQENEQRRKRKITHMAMPATGAGMAATVNYTMAADKST